MGGTMKRKPIVAMYAALVAVSFVALVLAVSSADAATRGVPRVLRSGATCQTLWTNPYFRGNVLTVRGTIKCSKPMRWIHGYASLLRMRLSEFEQLGEPSPQASAHDDFYLYQSTYYAFQVSHVCRPSAVSYKWWFTIRATWFYKFPFKSQTRQAFSSTLITDCG